MKRRSFLAMLGLAPAAAAIQTATLSSAEKPSEFSAENLAAIQAKQLVARDFLWINARTLDTGAPYSHGFWLDAGNVSAPVLNQAIEAR